MSFNKSRANYINYWSMIGGVIALVLIYLISLIFFPTENNDGGINFEEESCVQVITPAVNKETGEVKNFSTPCDIPQGWEELGQ